MKFNITIVEPPGYRFTHFLFPLCKLLSCGLESLGHDCYVTRNTLDPSRITIIVAGHLLNSPQEADAISEAGKYIVFQSEAIKDGILHFGKASRLPDAYVRLLGRSLCVWESVSAEHVPMIEKFGARAHVLLGGYHASLEEISPKRSKDIDFLFFGSMSPHRKALLDGLKRRGHVLVTMFDEHAFFRNELIARTKVHLAPKQYEQLGHLPWSRLTYLLNNRSLVVSERCSNQEWLEDCFLWAETERWVDLCEETLLRDDREELTMEYYQRFKQRPFVDQLQKVLDLM